MAALVYDTTSPSRLDVVSPELVLVDPALAARARALLIDPDETLVRLGRPPRLSRERLPLPDSNAASPSSANDAAAAALRRISESALDSQLTIPVGHSARPGRRLVGLIAALAAAGSVAVFVVDQVDLRGAPTTANASELREPSRFVAASGDRSQSREEPHESPRPGGSLQPAGASTNPTLGAGSLSEQPVRPAEETDPGTRSVSSNTVRPSSAPGGQPGTFIVAPSDRRLTWAPVAGASGYHVELFRGRARIYVTDTTRARVTIPPVWDLGGRAHQLGPDDRLSVWPLVSGRRASEAIVDMLVVDMP